MSSIKSTVAFCLISALLLMASAHAATVAVNTTADDGMGTCTVNYCTLRDAISSAKSGDTITFSLPANSTITLVIGELLINKDLNIEGLGANLLTVQRSYSPGTHLFRIFHITAHVAIVGLTIAHGDVLVAPNDATRLGSGGGGIFNDGASASTLLINSAISGNRANMGGGIYNREGTVLMFNSTVSDNWGDSFGGGIANGSNLFVYKGSGYVEGSGDGGYDPGGTVAILSSTISGNSAYRSFCPNPCQGGGIYTNYGLMTISNSTIAHNAAADGGGIANGNINIDLFNIHTGSVEVSNSIIAGNAASYQFVAYGGGDFRGVLSSKGHNLISDTHDTVITGDTTGNKLNVDPLLGPLQDNGGPTKTHALLADSPAIDAGNAGGATVDQRGFARTVDYPGIATAIGGDGSDIGAYEALVNYSDSWWNANESGWGLTITDHNTNMFVQWYTYDQSGHNQKYVIAGGTLSANRCQFSGVLQRVTGPSWTLTTFDPNQVVRTSAGTATINFCPSGLAAGTILFSYTADGVTGSKQLTRLSFGNDVPHPGGAANTGGSDYTDLWWNPNESGWGVALTQHGNNVFARIFAYDTDSRPLLFVIPGVTCTSPSSFNGSVQLTTGPWFGSNPFDSSQVVRTTVGTASFNFTDANNGVLSYTISGVTRTKAITRLSF